VRGTTRYTSHDDVCRVAELAAPHITMPHMTRYAGWQNLLHPMLLRLKIRGMHGGRICYTLCCYASHDQACRVAELAAPHMTTPHLTRYARWKNFCCTPHYYASYDEVCRVAEPTIPRIAMHILRGMQGGRICSTKHLMLLRLTL